MKACRTALCVVLLLPSIVVSAAELDEDAGALLGRSRAMAASFARDVEIAVRAALEMGAALRAINACRFTAIELASEISRRSGWRVARVSLRPFNPAVATADVWEQRVLADFQRRAAQGTAPDTLEHGELVEEPGGRAFRFMRAIPVGPTCLGCHGTSETMTAAMRDALYSAYPKMPAIGLRSGDVAGAVSVRSPP